MISIPNNPLQSYIYRFLYIPKAKYLLKQKLKNQKQLRLILGASNSHYPGWIATEKWFLDVTKPTDWQRATRHQKINALLAEHVFEHLTSKQARLATSLCFQFLKPSGYLRIAVPDGYHPSKTYIDYVKPGGTGEGADDHQVLYNINTLSKLLKSVGFTVKPLEHFDKKGKFHSKPWKKESGMIKRSIRYDSRNSTGKPTYTSLILDAIKPPS